MCLGSGSDDDDEESVHFRIVSVEIKALAISRRSVLNPLAYFLLFIAVSERECGSIWPLTDSTRSLTL